MKHIKNRNILQDDKILFTVQDLQTGEIFTQLKRQNASCPISQSERMAYRDFGFIHLIKIIRNRHNDNAPMTLRKAVNIAKHARGY